MPEQTIMFASLSTPGRWLREFAPSFAGQKVLLPPLLVLAI